MENQNTSSDFTLPDFLLTDQGKALAHLPEVSRNRGFMLGIPLVSSADTNHAEINRLLKRALHNKKYNTAGEFWEYYEKILSQIRSYIAKL